MVVLGSRSATPRDGEAVALRVEQEAASVTFNKQAAIDAALMIIGSAIGASATVALFLYAWSRRPVQGAPDREPGEPLK